MSTREIFDQRCFVREKRDSASGFPCAIRINKAKFDHCARRVSRSGSRIDRGSMTEGRSRARVNEEISRTSFQRPIRYRRRLL